MRSRAAEAAAHLDHTAFWLRDIVLPAVQTPAMTVARCTWTAGCAQPGLYDVSVDGGSPRSTCRVHALSSALRLIAGQTVTWRRGRPTPPMRADVHAPTGHLATLAAR